MPRIPRIRHHLRGFIDITSRGMKQEIVLHMNPEFGSQFVEFIPNDFHTRSMPLLFRRFHIIIHPGIRAPHLRAVLLAGIIIHAIPVSNHIDVRPHIQYRIHGLLKQVKSLTRGKCDNDARGGAKIAIDNNQ